MNASPAVYIIILNWNGWKDTLVCIESAKNLDYPNFKIIVVDNASTNDSVQRISDAHPDIKLLLSPANLGFAGGNNIGIEFAIRSGADYVWLLNNDARAASDALTHMVRLAESDGKIGAVGSMILNFSPPHGIQAWGGGRVSFISGRSKHLMESGTLDYVTGASMLLRSTSLQNVGMLDSNFFMYWEDADLCFRLRSSYWKIAVADQSKVYHKDSASLGKTNLLMDIYYNSSAVLFYYKHSRMPIFPIVVGVLGRASKRALKGEYKKISAILKSSVKAFINVNKSDPRE